MIECWIDGSVDKNPGKIAGWAWMIDGTNDASYGAEHYPDCDATNQKAEALALLNLLKFVIHFYISDNICVIYTDSEYIIGCFTGKYRIKANRELWQNILTLKDQIGADRFELKWVKGHSGNINNEKVDKLAKLAVSKMAVELECRK